MTNTELFAAEHRYYVGVMWVYITMGVGLLVAIVTGEVMKWRINKPKKDERATGRQVK